MFKVLLFFAVLAVVCINSAHSSSIHLVSWDLDQTSSDVEEASVNVDTSSCEELVNVDEDKFLSSTTNHSLVPKTQLGNEHTTEKGDPHVISADEFRDAIIALNMSAISMALKAGASPNEIVCGNGSFGLAEDRCFPPLFHACHRDSMELAEIMLNAKADVDANSNGVPVLLGCMFLNRIDIAKLLVEHGADVNATFPTPKGTFSAVAAAAVAGDLGLIDLLLKGSAGVPVGSLSPLLSAIAYNHEEIAVRLLHAFPAEPVNDSYILAMADQGMVSGLRAANRYHPTVLVSALSFLNRYDLNCANLNDAMESWSPQVMDFAISVASNAAEKNRHTTCDSFESHVMLHSACRYAHTANVMRFVLTHMSVFVDVNAKNLDGSTALHVCTTHDLVESVKILLTNDRVNKTAKDSKGRTARDIARSRQNVQMFELLSPKRV